MEVGVEAESLIQSDVSSLIVLHLVALPVKEEKSEENCSGSFVAGCTFAFFFTENRLL